MAIQIFQFKDLESTQDKIFELFDQNHSSPFIVVAENQIKGRGRMKREWISEKNKSLTMSMGVQIPSHRLEALSLVIGLAVSDAIANSSLKIKWPNDLMLSDQKVGGILIESRSHGDRAMVSIGIGLNLDDLQTAPYRGIGLRIEVDSLGQKIETRLKLFLDHGFSIFQKEYESKLWRMGENAVLTIDGVENKIRILGVTERGLLKTEQKGELYLSDQGEILAPSKI